MTDMAPPIVRSPKRAEAWARKAFRRAAAAGAPLAFRTTFNAAGVVAGASPQTVVDTAYTPSSSARGIQVSIVFGGTVTVSTAVTVQIQRDGAVLLGTQGQAVVDAASGKFGGTLIVNDNPGPGAHTYSLVLTFTGVGAAVTVPVGSVQYNANDLT